MSVARRTLLADQAGPRREVNKKERHLPLRRVFGRVPNLLVRLKPCLMMSPLAVSTYLNVSFPGVDGLLQQVFRAGPTNEFFGGRGRSDQFERGLNVITLGKRWSGRSGFDFGGQFDQ